MTAAAGGSGTVGPTAKVSRVGRLSMPAAGLALRVALLLLVPAGPLVAQRPVGSVGAGAVGTPAPVARPIGGLVTTPLGDGANALPGAVRGGRIGWWPLAVADARALPNGARPLAAADIAPAVARAPRWLPTSEPPTWTVDTTARYQAWREVTVRDVVCDLRGACLARETRLRAPWVARWRGYYFSDGLGRWWRVE